MFWICAGFFDVTFVFGHQPITGGTTNGNWGLERVYNSQMGERLALTHRRNNERKLLKWANETHFRPFRRLDI